MHCTRRRKKGAPEAASAPTYWYRYSPGSVDSRLFTTNQRLTLLHYSAQREPFLTQKHTRNTPNTPYHPLDTPATTPNCTPCHTEGA